MLKRSGGLEPRKEFENKIKITCSFNNAKCEFIQGTLTVDKTNISL